MTILVTGASGHLGRLVVTELLARGTAPDQIIATARTPEAIADLGTLGVIVRRADYSDPQTLKEAFAGADRVLLVSSSEVGSRSEQHRNVIDAALDAGVELLAYTSILRADTSTLLLAREHQATESMIVESGLPYVFLRNSWYHENYTEQIATALEHHAVLGSAGEGRVSAASRADYAAAAAAVLVGDGPWNRSYELAGDTAYTMAEYAATLSRLSGQDVAYVDQPAADYQAVLESVGLPAPVAQILAGADLGLGRGELLDESGTLSDLIGRPTTSLTDAIASALA